jgi:hypothetical protein
MPDVLAMGHHTITAVYEGDCQFAGCDGGPVDVEVALARTITTLTTSSDTVTSGHAFTLKAKVQNAAEDFVGPTGTVTIRDGDQVLAVLALDGQTTTISRYLEPGEHRFTAEYSGDANCLASQSDVVIQTVTGGHEINLPTGIEYPAVQQKPQMTQIRLQQWGGASKSHTPVYTATILLADGRMLGRQTTKAFVRGKIQSVTSSLKVTLQGKSAGQGVLTGVSTSLTTPDTLVVSWLGGPTPTGYVRFMDGTRVVARVKVDANGTATWAPKSFKSGKHSITAVYEGDEQYLTSRSGKHNVTVGLTATRLMFGASVAGNVMTLSTKVATVAEDTVTPTGTVTIRDGRKVLAVLKLGEARSLTLSLSAGRHNLTAEYSGDSNCRKTHSAVLVHIVQARQHRLGALLLGVG